jgi:hypothetical protein
MHKHREASARFVFAMEIERERKRHFADLVVFSQNFQYRRKVGELIELGNRRDGTDARVAYLVSARLHCRPGHQYLRRVDAAPCILVKKSRPPRGIAECQAPRAAREKWKDDCNQRTRHQRRRAHLPNRFYTSVVIRKFSFVCKSPL